MKVFITLFFVFTISSVMGQYENSCDQKPVLIVGSLSVKSNITAEAKIGLWQNNHIGGVTLFGGIMTDVANSSVNNKSKSYTHSDEGFFELGYKFRLSKRLFSHTMIGAMKGMSYAGTELLYQADGSLLMGLNYKNGTLGFIIYVHF